MIYDFRSAAAAFMRKAAVFAVVGLVSVLPSARGAEADLGLEPPVLNTQPGPEYADENEREASELPRQRSRLAPRPA
jgi:hypothetical protein